MTYPSLELVGVVVEGALDRVAGRPRAKNPYSWEHAQDAHEAWRWGWDDADRLMLFRFQDEVRRWLEAV